MYVLWEKVCGGGLSLVAFSFFGVVFFGSGLVNGFVKCVETFHLVVKSKRPVLCSGRLLCFGLVVDLGPGSVGVDSDGVVLGVDGDGVFGVGVGEHVNDALGGGALFVHGVLLTVGAGDHTNDALDGVGLVVHFVPLSR